MNKKRTYLEGNSVLGININGVKAIPVTSSESLDSLIMDGKKVSLKLVLNGFARNISNNFDRVCLNLKISETTEPFCLDSLYIVKYNKHYSNQIVTTESFIDSVGYEIFPLFESECDAMDFIKTITTSEMDEFIIQKVIHS